MLISNFALMDLSVRQHSVVKKLRGLLGFAHVESATATVFHHQLPAPELAIVPDLPESSETLDAPSDFRWRRHPQLLSGMPVASISDEERRARKTAVRGLYCAHNGEIEEAFLNFVHAINLAPIDLTEMPSFWQMPRGAILAAADAYELAGRLREATVIQARVRTELRPRNVVPLQRSAATPSLRRTANRLARTRQATY